MAFIRITDMLLNINFNTSKKSVQMLKHTPNQIVTVVVNLPCLKTTNLSIIEIRPHTQQFLQNDCQIW